MGKTSLPFSTSVLDGLWFAHPAGTSFPSSSVFLLARPFRSTVVNALLTVGVDVIAAVGGRRITLLMLDLNRDHSSCEIRNGGESTNPDSTALFKRLSMLRTPENGYKLVRSDNVRRMEETHHRQNLRTFLSWNRCAQLRQRFLENSRRHPSGE